jgi:Flp pilus assembly protein CpaB
VLTELQAGQVITKNLFPKEGTGLYVAANLAPGMRAVSIALKGQSGLEGLIYPGCLVDVIATFKLESNSKLGEAVSTTLLENIRVLAVEDIAVGQNMESTQDGVEKAAAQRAVAARGMYVTLLVDAKQAEALQLAVDRGTVSLAMRNPEDLQTGDAVATLLNQGRLAEYAGSLEAYVAPEEPDPASFVSGPPSAAPSAESAVKVSSAVSGEKAAAKPEPHWTVDILRGVTREVRELKLPSWR